ncbi:hypothetical protein BDFB_013309 [Asbolus verrucosus]|uniref:Uncharacterized protein n=1 Tax=Asbolus verrucosus TaxID=1661398 RepID=A0A482VXX4_ASBVE|nr:hypothetical protein BDFB_013309 [Asbolus verrucosus]
MTGNYSFNDLAHMHLIYGENRSEVIPERFPNRHVPHRDVFSNRRLPEFGNMRPISVDRDRPVAANTVDRDKHVSVTTAWTTISNEHLRPYHINGKDGLADVIPFRGPPGVWM